MRRRWHITRILAFKKARAASVVNISKNAKSKQIRRRVKTMNQQKKKLISNQVWSNDALKKIYWFLHFFKIQHDAADRPVKMASTLRAQDNHKTRYTSAITQKQMWFLPLLFLSRDETGDLSATHQKQSWVLSSSKPSGIGHRSSTCLSPIFSIIGKLDRDDLKL